MICFSITAIHSSRTATEHPVDKSGSGDVVLATAEFGINPSKEIVRVGSNDAYNR